MKGKFCLFFYSKKAFLFLAKKERQQFDNKIASSSIHKKMKGKILPVFLKQKGFSFFGKNDSAFSFRCKKRKGKTFLIVQQNCLFFYSQKKRKAKFCLFSLKAKRLFFSCPFFFWQKGNSLTLPFLFVAKKKGKILTFLIVQQNCLFFYSHKKRKAKFCPFF